MRGSRGVGRTRRRDRAMCPLSKPDRLVQALRRGSFRRARSAGRAWFALPGMRGSYGDPRWHDGTARNVNRGSLCGTRGRRAVTLLGGPPPVAYLRPSIHDNSSFGRDPDAGGVFRLVASRYYARQKAAYLPRPAIQTGCFRNVANSNGAHTAPIVSSRLCLECGASGLWTGH